MKFRTLRKLTYLRNARHRLGFGIHSPWLFRLITEVIEDKKRLPEYKIIEFQRIRLAGLIRERQAVLMLNTFFDHQLKSTCRRNLLKAVELPSKYGKLLFRLVNDFKPKSIAFFGPTFGLNLLYFALSDLKIPVNYYKPANYPDEFCQEILKDANIQKINCLNNEDRLFKGEEFVFINSAFDAEMIEKLIASALESASDNTLIIIRGIHDSAQMESVWDNFIQSARVNISLDLFEICIAIFFSKFQKEHFILRF